ncbi:MAG: helix-turn-helix domain-containing protein [Sulfitobacter sp. SK025]|nr:MAG: helix-turn-helix domain-containing protein [Sulfitobacter sp. SK025]
MIDDQTTTKPTKQRTSRTLGAHLRNIEKSDHQLPIHVGRKIRSLRKSIGMTIENLSAQVKMSIGHISQIERDISSPTLSALQEISRVLNVNISYFFSDMLDQESERKYITTQEERRCISFASGLHECQLNTQEINSLQVLLSTFEPGASFDHDYSHEGGGMRLRHVR